MGRFGGSSKRGRGSGRSSGFGGGKSTGRGGSSSRGAGKSKNRTKGDRSSRSNGWFDWLTGWFADEPGSPKTKKHKDKTPKDTPRDDGAANKKKDKEKKPMGSGRNGGSGSGGGDKTAGGGKPAGGGSGSGGTSGGGPLTAQAEQLAATMSRIDTSDATAKEKYLNDLASAQDTLARAYQKVLGPKLGDMWDDPEMSQTFANQGKALNQMGQGIRNAVAGWRRRKRGQFENLDNPGSGDARTGYDVSQQSS
jgi:hypothetical protein